MLILSLMTAMAATVPADVKTLADNVEACIHFAGEEPYDEDRARYLNQMTAETCDPARAAFPKLKAKYAGDPEALAEIARAEPAWIDALGAL